MEKKSVLVVDDDQDILTLFQYFLKEESLNVDYLANSSEVMNKLKFKKYDLVITDILMPEINGIELTKMIKDSYPSLNVLVCSEGGSTDAKEIVAGIVMNKALNFGAIYALKKPFNKKELLTTLYAVLEGRLPEN